MNTIILIAKKEDKELMELVSEKSVESIEMAIDFAHEKSEFLPFLLNQALLKQTTKQHPIPSEHLCGMEKIPLDEHQNDESQHSTNSLKK